MPKLPLRQAIVCEGKYDAIRLGSLFDTLVLPTDGFRIYNDGEKRALFRRIAAQRGLIAATDSDAAGFQIRAYLKSFLPAEQLWHVYIPDIPGREKRKSVPSKEGKLGVEGMDTQVLLKAFDEVIKTQDVEKARRETTKLDLYRDGFSGTAGCRERYHALLHILDLPALLSTNVFCACVGREEYTQAKEKLREVTCA
jgi:ribonuclease M5